jgi:hypothetical protein
MQLVGHAHCLLQLLCVYVCGHLHHQHVADLHTYTGKNFCLKNNPLSCCDVMLTLPLARCRLQSLIVSSQECWQRVFKIISDL